MTKIDCGNGSGSRSRRCRSWTTSTTSRRASGGATRGRSRRVASLVVVGLMVGGVGGYLAGRVVRDDTNTVTVGGAPESRARPTPRRRPPSPSTTCDVEHDVRGVRVARREDDPRMRRAVADAAGARSRATGRPDRGPHGCGAHLRRTRTTVTRRTRRSAGAIEGGAGLVGRVRRAAQRPGRRRRCLGGEDRRRRHRVRFADARRGGVPLRPRRRRHVGAVLRRRGAQRRDGWQISHASYCQIIIPAGVHCPE